MKKTYLFMLLIFFCNISCSNNMRNSLVIHASACLVSASMGVGINMLYNKKYTLKQNTIVACVYGITPQILYEATSYICGINKIFAQLQANQTRLNNLTNRLNELTHSIPDMQASV